MIPINFKQFLTTLDLNTPPEKWPNALQTLWYDAKNDWESAHEIAQDMHDTTGSWLHAYLHRKEGDEFNASYWYRQARKPFPKITLPEEQQQLIEFVLKT